LPVFIFQLKALDLATIIESFVRIIKAEEVGQEVGAGGVGLSKRPKTENRKPKTENRRP
jgi:hypothetical protein